MAAIDFIEVGKPMPDWIPDYQVDNEGNKKSFQSKGLKIDERVGYSYIPYMQFNINNYDISALPREIISSRFSGCLMVAWEEGTRIYAGHVAIDEVNCSETWNLRRKKSSRSIVFKPSNYIRAAIDRNVPNIYGFFEFDEHFQDVTAFSVGIDHKNIVTAIVKVYQGPFMGHIGADETTSPDTASEEIK